MSSLAQRKALQTYREKLVKRGLIRFELMAPESDRSLLREVAASLTQGGAEADKIRTELKNLCSDHAPSKGGVISALRKSPLVGAKLKIERLKEVGRKVNL